MQLVQTAQAVIEGIQALTSGGVLEQRIQRLVEGLELALGVQPGLIDLLGQSLLGAGQ